MDMHNSGMTINAVAMNIGLSTCAILHPRPHFQATGLTADRHVEDVRPSPRG